MIEEERDVEEQESAVEETNQFDPSAFTDVDTLGETKEVENEVEQTNETTNEVKEVAEETENETSNVESSSEESSWTTDPIEEQEKVSKEVAETVNETSNESWKQIAEDAGINAEDYETFIDTLKNQQSLAQKGATNDAIENIKGLKSLDDEDLMRKELEAKGYKKDEIEDEIDILIENGSIRSEARKVRKDLDAAIEQESRRIASTPSEDNAMREKEAEEARIELEEYMSKTTEMFGGKINDSQKSEHIEYISNGDFFDEIGESVDNVAQAAWLWKYRKQIHKAMKSNGFEKGKAKILDELVHPETTKSTRIPDPETGEFNPTRFTDTNEM